MTTRFSMLAMIVTGLLCVGDGQVFGDDPPAVMKTAVTETGVSVSEGEKPVLFYQRTPTSKDGKYERAAYVHPLYDLDGEVLTEDFPADHLHHRGIFWAWHQLWVGDKPIGDGWATKDFSWVVKNIQVHESESEGAGFTATVYWQSPLLKNEQGDPLPLVRETSRILVHRSAGDTRNIDFRIELVALQKHMRLGGSDDEKGYGGFSTRIRLPKDIRFTGRNGDVEPQTGSIVAGPWMDMWGSFSEGKVSGVTILCHPTLPGFPQPWILRGSRSMQNPAWPGCDAVPLSDESPVVLRYRLVLHRGSASHDTIEKWQSEFERNAD